MPADTMLMQQKKQEITHMTEEVVGPTSFEALSKEIGLGERIEQFFKQSLPAIIGDATSAVVLFFLLFGTVSSVVLGTWFAVAQLLNVFLFSTYIMYRKLQPTPQQIFQHWRYALYFPSIVHGLTWGAFSIIAYYANHEWAYVVSLVVVMGLAAGSVPIMGTVFPLFVLHKIFLILPSGIVVFVAGEAAEKWGLMVFIAVFFNSIVFSGLVYYRSFLKTMQLRHENDGIVFNLKKEVETRKEIEAQLVEATTHAEAANIAKSSFLANMSHEIRTPLTSIIGFSEAIMKDTNSQQERARLAKTILRSSRHLLEIINDILDLSKIESNKLDFENIDTPIFEMMEDLNFITGEHIRDKGVSFEIQYQYPVPSVIQSDPVRLKQILINLCSNAAKFTHSGRILISVRCDAEKELIFFHVNDTGIGLPEDKLETIFEAFSQADSSTTRKYGGTGLGLNLSRRLAHALGGDLTAMSTVGIGSTFTLSIRTGTIRPEVMIENDESRPKVKPVAQTQLSTLKGKILIAEDTDVIQELIATLLQRAGVEYEFADNGKIAVEKTEKTKYDLIFMDMQMPVMDGIEATKTIRANGYKGPIIALTANAFKEDEEKCKQAGTTEFITKPIETDLFFTRLKHYLLPDADEDQLDDDAIFPTFKKASKINEKLAKKFVVDFESVINDTVSAFKKEDLDAVLSELHKIKGSSATFGYPQLGELAKAAEQLGKKKDISELAEKVEQMAQMFKKIQRGMGA